jgi:mannose-6-phosphate isomerase-like protein (cupin superfamily)
MQSVNIADKLTGVTDHWAPKIIARYDDNDIMVVKVEGEFVWHSHDDTDDFFLVLSGRLTIRTEHGDVDLAPGELFVVPRGVSHCPVAEEETHLLLLEPSGMPNNGDPATAVTKLEI